MMIRFPLGLIILLFSCSGRQTNQTNLALPGDSIQEVSEDNELLEKEDCHLWLPDADTTLSAGYFIKYIKENQRVKIQWGNDHFTRTLDKDYDCAGAASWVPSIRWSTSDYIGLKYGCGSPCWGSIILPKNDKDPVIERMYDLVIDTLGNRMVYLDNKTYDRFVLEDFVTGKQASIDYKFECPAAFVGFCIDTIGFDNKKLFVKWVEWSNDGKDKKIVTEEFELEF